MMEIVSKANSVRISPKKLRKVANLVRGLNVNKAHSSLSHMDEKGSAIILKTFAAKLPGKLIIIKRGNLGASYSTNEAISICLLYTSPSPRD